MKLCLLVLVTLAAVLACSAEEEHYNSKYDNFDIDEVIQNDRLFKSYVKCLRDQGRCTPEGTEFKRVVPEALETACAKCTEAQKKIVRRMVKAMQEKSLEDWDALVAKHDPEGKYKEGFEKFLKGE